MNQSFLALLGKIVFAAASLAIADVSGAGAFTSQLDEQLVSQQPARREAGRNNALLPEAITNAVLENLSLQTGTEISTLRIVDAQQQAWPDGCLGLASPGIVCARSMVPGWRVIVGSGQQRWVYRTNVSGSVVKLDAIATQSLAVAVTPPPPTRLPLPPARRTTASSRARQLTSAQLPQVGISESPPNNPETESAIDPTQPAAARIEPVTRQTESVTPRQEVITRQTESTTPRQTQPATPRPEVVTRQTESTTPRQTQPATPRPEVITRQTESTTPRQTQPATPRPEVITRQNESTTPRQTQPATPRPEVITRQTESTTPRQTQPATPRPEVITRQTESTTPRQTQPATPRPEVITRQTESTTPRQQIITRQTESTTPRQQIITRPSEPATRQTEPITTRQEVISRPSQPITRQTEVITPRSEPQAAAPSRQLPLDRGENRTSGPTNFSLTIRQPGATLADVIARVSLKAKNGATYAQERYIGDYRYRLNRRAFFRGGMNAGDRIVVRLYDGETKSLIGWSEFELLADDAAVNLIFSVRPFLHRMVRTTYGIDANTDGNIDVGKNVYDYYTQLVGTEPGKESVLFLKGMPDSNLNWFEIAGLPVPPRASVYPSSFAIGETNLTVRAFSSDLPRTITTVPGRQSVLTTLTSNNNSYDVGRLLGNNQVARNSRSPQPVLPEESPVSFADVPSNHWARNFIAQLAAKKILEGFPDGLYRPNAPVTRAELASILRKAFDRNKMRDVVVFRDVPSNHWAYPAIREAYEMGFLDPERSQVFNPDQKVTRLDVLVALGKGLSYSVSGSTDEILRVYRDATGIPSPFRDIVAAVTVRDMVVSYPNVKFLYPDRLATRAEVAALIYRALVSTGEAADIVSPYVVVAANNTTNQSQDRQPPRRQERQAAPTRRSSTSNEGVRRTGTVRQGGGTTPRPPASRQSN